MPRSLTARLVVGTLLWSAGVLTAGGLVLSYAFERSVTAAFDERLESIALALVAGVEIDASGGVRLVRPPADSRFDRVYAGRYWQIDRAGEPVMRSRSLWDFSFPSESHAGRSALVAQPSTVAAARTHRNDSASGRDDGRSRAPLPDERVGTVSITDGPRGERLRALELDVRWPRHDGALTVRVAADEREITQEAARFDRLLWTSLGVLGAGLAAALLLQAALTLRPIRRMAHDLERVRFGELSRLPGRYPMEIEPLARAVNDVLDHDASRIEHARTHVGNLAHALKTPLSIVRADVEGTDGPVADSVRRQVRAMTNLIGRYLARAAAAGTSRNFAARTEIGPVLHELRNGMLRIYAERRLDIVVEADAGLLFHGERQDLEEMLGNVLDNACKWAERRIRAEVVLEGSRLAVRVDDDGAGLAPHALRAVLERGARLDETTPGTGLGLAIAADLAVLYAGGLHLEAGPLGGLRARLVLPGGRALSGGRGRVAREGEPERIAGSGRA